mgnify:CR=1 FL=1
MANIKRSIDRTSVNVPFAFQPQDELSADYRVGTVYEIGKPNDTDTDGNPAYRLQRDRFGAFLVFIDADDELVAIGGDVGVDAADNGNSTNPFTVRSILMPPDGIPLSIPTGWRCTIHNNTSGPLEFKSETAADSFTGTPVEVPTSKIPAGKSGEVQKLVGELKLVGVSSDAGSLDDTLDRDIKVKLGGGSVGGVPDGLTLSETETFTQVFEKIFTKRVGYNGNKATFSVNDNIPNTVEVGSDLGAFGDSGKRFTISGSTKQRNSGGLVGWTLTLDEGRSQDRSKGMPVLDGANKAVIDGMADGSAIAPPSDLLTPADIDNEVVDPTTWPDNPSPSDIVADNLNKQRSNNYNFSYVEGSEFGAAPVAQGDNLSGVDPWRYTFTLEADFNPQRDADTTPQSDPNALNRPEDNLGDLDNGVGRKAPSITRTITAKYRGYFGFLGNSQGSGTQPNGMLDVNLATGKPLGSKTYAEISTQIRSIGDPNLVIQGTDNSELGYPSPKNSGNSSIKGYRIYSSLVDTEAFTAEAGVFELCYPKHWGELTEWWSLYPASTQPTNEAAEFYECEIDQVHALDGGTYSVPYYYYFHFPGNAGNEDESGTIANKLTFKESYGYGGQSSPFSNGGEYFINIT